MSSWKAVVPGSPINPMVGMGQNERDMTAVQIIVFSGIDAKIPSLLPYFFACVEGYRNFFICSPNSK